MRPSSRPASNSHITSIPSGRSSRAAYTARSSRPSLTTMLRLSLAHGRSNYLRWERRQASEGLDAPGRQRRQELIGGLAPQVVVSVLQSAASGTALPPRPDAARSVHLVQFNGLGGCSSRQLVQSRESDPGGPRPSVTKYRVQGPPPQEVRWTELTDWTYLPPSSYVQACSLSSAIFVIVWRLSLAPGCRPRCPLRWGQS